MLSLPRASLHVLFGLALLTSTGCILFKPANKVFIPEQAPPPAATSGSAVRAFGAIRGQFDPRTAKDDDGDLIVPEDGKVLAWYPTSAEWEVDRNDLGVVIDRYGQAVVEYRVGDTCYWTNQNFYQEAMGGGSFGGTKLSIMARTRAISKFACPAGQ
jgi:hypothetical protein